ncbi:MAG: hypothetical protein AAFR21_15700 [Pseudomonadota bacterium]
MRLKNLLVTSALSTVVALSGPAAAEDNWDFTTTAYGWFAGLSGTVETPIGDVETEVDFGDILESLDIAFLGAFDARKNRLSLIADVQYFDLSSDVDVPTGALFSGGEADSQTVLLSAYAAYALVDNDDMRFELGGGLRYTYADIDVDLVGQEPVADQSVSVDGDYVDLLIAARLTRNFTDRLYGVAFADVGGFGIEDSSDLTWQAAGVVGYRFNEKWSVLGGYRHLSIHREFGPTDTTTEVSGPFLGFQASF